MAGLGKVAYAPLVVEGRWLPALTVTTDRPAVACLAAQYAGWRLDRDGYFAMASGPGRALIRAEELFEDLDVDERASTAVLCLEARDERIHCESPWARPFSTVSEVTRSKSI